MRASALSVCCTLLLLASSSTAHKSHSRHRKLSASAGAFKRANSSESHHPAREVPSESDSDSGEAGETKRGGFYELVDEYSGYDFFDGWNFIDESDPTHGYVSYLDGDTANDLGLAYVDPFSGRAVMKVDSTTDLPTPPAGQVPHRNSVRISTAKEYNHGLFVLDAAKFPFGCSVWPAFWMFGPNWPTSGEVDIFEGVNLNTVNQYTAHTSPGCTLDTSPPRDFVVDDREATVGLTDCNPSAGCYYKDNTEGSYGPELNEAGGAVLAMLWTSDGIKIWNFPRDDVPYDLESKYPIPSTWGKKYLKAAWAAPTCPTDQYFKNMNIVFDITLCGDWAGNAYASSGCPGTCANQVLTGSNFADAVWEVNYVKVFQQ